MSIARRFPIGSECGPDGRIHFRLWAPETSVAEIVYESGKTERMQTDSQAGYFTYTSDVAKVGTTYRFRLDGKGPFPDPASRFQPDGPFGPSEVIDSESFPWTDGAWKGVSRPALVLYEMHVGTFTPEGTWHAATRQLPELAALGVNCLEVMPVADFPGRFGWGYDGVNPFAPTRLYGRPDDFRQFVDTAHGLGIGVILDVVYNHLGPDGNFLAAFADRYFTDRYKTDWGRAINFDGPNSGPVREFVIANARYWVEEFHLDGLRLDATQNIYDDAKPDRHILTEIGMAVRNAAGGRDTLIVNENESQHAELARPVEDGGYGLDAMWNDDYHHTATVALTGRSESYYTDYRGSPQELISALKYGFLYQGQWYSWQTQRRGHPAHDLPPHAFVNFLQNHDQIANSASGLRAHVLTSPGRYRALHALTLLGPGTPMLFQGQEFQASAPFLYFADHKPELAALIREGRKSFLKQFPVLNDPATVTRLAPPDHPDTFERCKLNFHERTTHRVAYDLTRDLLALRRSEPALVEWRPHAFDGAVLGPHAFVLRFFRGGRDDRLLVVNLGANLDLATCPEPLLAPPIGCQWDVVLHTENLRYGGGGVIAPETVDRGWQLTAESAAWLAPRPADPVPPRAER
jgi:maltooligosyltrehalose trehalohydrolase